MLYMLCIIQPIVRNTLNKQIKKPSFSHSVEFVYPVGSFFGLQ